MVEISTNMVACTERCIDQGRKVHIADLPGLMKAVKAALPGDGTIEAMVDSAPFEISSREFTRMITACKGLKQWKKALEILEVAKQKHMSGCPQPNIFTYSAVISVCCRSGRLQEGLRLLDEMKSAAKANSALAPDSIVYRLLVGCCLKLGRYNQVVDLYQECVDAGLEPDDHTLQHVLNALIYLKEWKNAADVMDMLHVRRGCLPVQQYNVFIEACCNVDNLEMATEVLLTMQMLGVSPNVHTCRHIVQAIEAAGLPELGVQFVKDAQSCGIRVPLATLVRVLIGSQHSA